MTREEVMKAALEMIAAGHIASPNFPHGHIYSATCPACHVGEVAKAALRGDQWRPK